MGVHWEGIYHFALINPFTTGDPKSMVHSNNGARENATSGKMAQNEKSISKFFKNPNFLEIPPVKKKKNRKNQ